MPEGRPRLGFLEPKCWAALLPRPAPGPAPALAPAQRPLPRAQTSPFKERKLGQGAGRGSPEWGIWWPVCAARGADPALGYRGLRVQRAGV